jgi:diguanylate cyclase (GGDEF)-like protein
MVTSIDAEARECARLAELASYRILDSGPEAAFDAIVHAASLVAGVPGAGIGLIDADREWFKASVGLPFDSFPREGVFCDHVVRDRAPIVIEDASRDERFADSPYVLADGGVRFYAGFPLVTPSGAVLGTLCVNDADPRVLSPEQVQVLWTLADQVMAQLELRRQAAEAYAARDEAHTRGVLLNAVLETVDVGILVCDAVGQLSHDNAYNRALFGISVQEIVACPPAARTAVLPMATRNGVPLAPNERPLARALREGALQDVELVVSPDGLPARTVRVRGRQLIAPGGEVLGAMIASHDVTGMREREAELSLRARDSERLAEASRKILAGQAPAEAACEAVLALCCAQQVSLLMPDGAGALTMGATTDPILANLRVPLDVPSLVGTAFDTREPLLLDPGADPRTYSEGLALIERSHGPVGGALFLPLVSDEECRAVMTVTTTQPISQLPSRVFSLLEVITGELLTSLERDRLRRELALQASTDPLTGLANRRTWDERVAWQMTAAGGAPLCLAILDLDHFKLYNDGYGHQAGDDLLRAATAAWTGGIRTNDTLARLGGEEFGLLLPGCSLADAITVLDGLRVLVPQGQSVSIGVAERRPEETAAAWYARADRALYRAKADGRDQVCCHDEPFVDRRLRALPAQPNEPLGVDVVAS